ncbi:cupin domain-containing protein [Brucella tritici]|uniref:Cupin domain-containing protein n=1 Tax=Brucella tritici TaxID=94626 RepID=A0A6L3Y6R9_9HYPH|nr:cupin domain-containing protein [Brucella tritici]KAB2679259.1 cupin domain-containing protein [Brucella tritici]MBJ6719660.1 DUF861 domain-containing protein [Bacillus sp. PR5]NKW10617.1 cupin domain-containing protein [Brucella tritici]
MQKDFNLLRNVINLGVAPSCASDLEAAFQAITLDGQSTEPFGVGRAVLSGEGQDVKSLFPSIVMLRDGALTLIDRDGCEIVLAKGEAASLPGCTFSWKARAADCVILTIHEENAPASFTKLDLDHPMATGGAPNAALLTTPAPTTYRHEFQSDDPLAWGIWATTPYARHPITYSFSELMMLRKGEVTLSNPDEGSVTFVAGDIFIIRPGAVAAWDNPSDLHKFWIVHSEK